MLHTVGRKVDLDDLMDAGDVADLLGLSHRNAVSVYQHRFPEMPRPVFVRSNGKVLLWLRTEMVAWLRETGRR
jgi:hypothetical protein